MSCDERIGFDQWVAYVFDHPVTKPEWHWDDDAYFWNGSRADVVAYLTRTFEECNTLLQSFSEAQVAQGLWFLIDGVTSSYVRTLLDADVPLVDRLHCIDAMATLFECCFVVRCSPHLSQLDVNVTPEAVSALNGICYIWWDVLPLHGLVVHQPEHPDAAALDQAIMAALKRILTLDSIACQESALFGLADWAIYYPELGEVIDDFIDHHRELFERFKPGIRKAVFGCE